MSKYLFFGFFILGLIAASCDQSGSAGTKSTKSVKIDHDGAPFPLSIQKKGYTNLDAVRAEARTLIDYRGTNGDKPMSMLTANYWNPEFVFNAGHMSAEDLYKGYWIKYEDDFTYEYGTYGKLLGSGRYHFTLDSNELIMLDDDVDQEPKTWTANNNGEMMSYVGTHGFGVNNGMQMKMVPMDAKPTK